MDSYFNLFLDCFFFRDEAHFHLSCHVNRQNFRFRVSEQPHEHVEKWLSVENMMVKCVLESMVVWGHISLTMMIVIG